MVRTNTYKINTVFVKELSQEEKKAFALVLKIKNRFVSSHIHKYTVSRLASELNLSRYFIDKYMGIILAKEWGVMLENSDVIIKCFEKIYGDIDYYYKSSIRIKIDSSMNYNDVLDELNFIILQKNLSEQEYRVIPKRIDVCLKNNRNIRLSRSEFSRYKRLCKENKQIFDGELVCEGVLGMRRLSELLGCSINCVIAFLKRMEEQGRVKLKHIKRVFSDKCDISKGMYDFYSNRIGHFYKSKGIIYQFVGTGITINESMLH